MLVRFFFFNDTATTEIYTLSLHDALPIYQETRPAIQAAAPSRGRRFLPESRTARADDVAVVAPPGGAAAVDARARSRRRGRGDPGGAGRRAGAAARPARRNDAPRSARAPRPCRRRRRRSDEPAVC